MIYRASIILLFVAVLLGIDPGERQRIDDTLTRIEASPLRFIRNGSEFDGRKAASHLRDKLKNAGDRIRTFDDFVDKIATRSSMSGQPYLVNLQDGSTIELAKWIRKPPSTAPSSQPASR